MQSREFVVPHLCGLPRAHPEREILQTPESTINNQPPAITTHTRHIVITGASRGLGRAIAHEFAAPGARIGVHYARNKHAAERTAAALAKKGAAPYLIRADFLNEDAVASAVGRITAQKPDVDVLVLNAGTADERLLVRTSETDWDRTMDVNCRAPVKLLNALADSCFCAGSHVIMIGSLVGLRGHAGLSAYAAAKGALLGFVRDAAARLGPRGIFVNAIMPGLLRTDMMSQIDDREFCRMASENVLGRPTTCEEVAKFIAFLSTLHNVSGQVFALDSRLHYLRFDPSMRGARI